MRLRDFDVTPMVPTFRPVQVPCILSQMPRQHPVVQGCTGWGGVTVRNDLVRGWRIRHNVFEDNAWELGTAGIEASPVVADRR